MITIKKFSRTFKKAINKLKTLVSFEEILRLKQWLIDLCIINKKILITREQRKNEKLKFGYSKIVDLEKEPAKRGEIFFVDFGFGIGSEYRYNHYCAILKVEGRIAIVVPLTSQNSSHNQNSSLVIDLGIINKMPGTPKNSYALVNQIRAISRARLKRPSINGKNYFPKLNSEQLNKIDSIIDLLKK